MIETYPLEGAAEAYARMLSGKAQPEPPGLWRRQPSARRAVELEVVFEVVGEEQ
jgi:hypothetical protein